MSTSSTESIIRNFLVTHFEYRGATQSLGADVQLLDEGILDSTSVQEVGLFLEEELGITVDDEDWTPDNFGSIENLVGYVDRKKNSGAA